MLSGHNMIYEVRVGHPFIDHFCNITDKPQSRSNVALPPLEAPSSRRPLLVSVGTSLVTMTCCYGFYPSMVWAEEKSSDKEDDDKGVIGAIKSLFDPNEKTKKGKVLPKAYLKSAREVVKTLRESLNEAPNDIAKFRRTADSAKESIREYLGSWRGKQNVAQEVYTFLVFFEFVAILFRSTFTNI